MWRKLVDINMMKQAMELKSKMDKVQKELSKTVVEGESGKGAVKVQVNGQQKILSVKIAPEVINPNKAGELEKLVLKAVEEAMEASHKIATEEMKKLTGGLNIPGLT
jgi:DNA-binding YbaB/EbfC family protein